MIYDYGMMYQTLDRYVKNDINENEHSFIYELKWPDTYPVIIANDRFWFEIQNFYDIYVPAEYRERIETVADLKTIIEKGVQGFI